MNDDRGHRFPWPLVLVATMSLLLGSVSLIYPFGRDQGIFAFIADSLLLGKVLYRDVLDIKPPLTAMVHTLALILFGHSMTAIRILDLLWTAATALVLFAFVSRAFKSQWLGAAAGSLYPLLYFAFGFWDTAQTDGWLNLPVAGALLLSLLTGEHEGRNARLLWLGSGLCCGLAILLKYTVGVLPLLLLLTLLISRRARFRGTAAAAACLTLGVLVPLLVCGFALLASGAMPSFIESQFGLVPAYASVGGSGGLQVRVGNFLGTFVLHPELRLPALLLVAGSMTAALLFLRSARWQPGLILLAVWLLVACGSTFSQGKFFTYHYLPLLPVAAVAGGLTVGAIVAKLGPARLLAVAAVAAVLLLGTGYPLRLGRLVRIIRGRESVRDYWVSDLHNKGPSFSLRDDIELADYLRQTTLPSDRILIWGFEPGVNFLARRGTVTRFIYTLPLVVNYDPRRFRAEFMRTFVRDPVEVFVVEHGDAMPWATGSHKDSYAALREFRELLHFIDAKYRADTSICRFDVLRLTAAGHR
jgi:hypothetical protein